MANGIKCILCDKTFPKFDRRWIIVHYLDDHQGNLAFLTDEQLKDAVELLPKT